MNSFLKSTLFSIFISLVIITTSLAQTYGQLFTKQEADEKFGLVLQSIDISRSAFESFLTQTSNYIMFKVKDKNAIVLDNKRKVIYPEGVLINSNETFTMYSISVVNELLSKGNEKTVHIEQRSEVLSISSGGFTMEIGALCPPICPY